MALSWATYLAARHRVHPPAWALIVAAALLPGLFWTDNLLNTATFAVRLVALGIVGRHLMSVGVRRDVLAAGMSAILIGQSLLLIMTISEPRPAGLSLNASQVSSTGLMLWMVSPIAGFGWAGVATAVMHLGVGLGRTGLLAAAVFGLMTFSRRRIVAGMALGIVIAFAATAQDEWTRFQFDAGGWSVRRTAALRNDLLVPPTPAPTTIPTATSIPTIRPDITPVAPTPTPSPTRGPSVVVSARPGTYLCFGGDCEHREPIVVVPEKAKVALFRTERLHGYGWGSYLASTGQNRPHSIFVLAWYEMGLFVLVPLGLMGWAMWRRKLPWKVWLPLIALGLLTEEMTGRPEGFYMLAPVIVAFAADRARCSTLSAPTRAATG